MSFYTHQLEGNPPPEYYRLNPETDSEFFRAAVKMFLRIRSMPESDARAYIANEINDQERPLYEAFLSNTVTEDDFLREVHGEHACLRNGRQWVHSEGCGSTLCSCPFNVVDLNGKLLVWQGRTCNFMPRKAGPYDCLVTPGLFSRWLRDPVTGWDVSFCWECVGRLERSWRVWIKPGVSDISKRRALEYHAAPRLTLGGFQVSLTSYEDRPVLNISSPGQEPERIFP